MDIKTAFLVITFFNAVSLGPDGKTEVYQRDCKLMFTYGYGYNKYFHVSQSGGYKGRNLTIRFLVRARSDAHLLLSTAPSPSEDLPVYEIVLGAGKNTFSDIRRLRRSATRATAATKDLLSPTELRGFWVHFDSKGLIQIGKEGDDTPFLFWSDPTPLDIQYFSFCTWTGVVGKWLYDCPIENDTEEIEVVEEKPATMTEKLRKDLLTNYDPYALPLIDIDHRIAVFIALVYHHVTLDIKQSKIIIDGTMSMHWLDEKIKWKPEDYGGLKVIHVNEHEVWLPEILLYNAVGHGADIFGHAGMVINSNGEVLWSPLTHLEAWCNLDVNEWPNDEHTCELQLGFWTQRDSLELLIINNETVTMDEKRTGSEWEVIKVEAETVITNAPWIQDIDFDDFMLTADSLIVKITLRRQSQPYSTILIAPLIVISVLMMLSFWISPESSSKIGTVCISLVLLAFFITMVENVLPAPTDHVPCLVLLYSWSMMAGVLIILTSTFVICLTCYTHKNPPPSLLSLIITHPIIQTIMLLPKATNEPGKTYNHLEETSDENESSPEISTRIVTPTHQEIQQYWIVLATAIDRIAFMVYTVFLIIMIIKYH